MNNERSDRYELTTPSANLSLRTDCFLGWCVTGPWEFEGGPTDHLRLQERGQNNKQKGLVGTFY